MTKLPLALLGLATLALVPAAQAKDKKPVDPNKKVCHSETPTGSLMAKVVCHTAAEWAQINAVNAASVQDMHDRSSRSGTAQ